MAVAGKYRRGTMTSPATASIVDIDFESDDAYDDRTGDTDMWCKKPVMLKEKGSLNFTLCSGDPETVRDAIQNVDVTLVVEDVSMAANVETITSRTLTFKNAYCPKRGISANNDGGQSSGKISCQFGEIQ